MREYFTIMIKENDTTNLKLLQEKLTEGFYLNDRIEVGRSTVLTMQRMVETNSSRTTNRTVESEGVPVSLGLETAITYSGRY